MELETTVGGCFNELVVEKARFDEEPMKKCLPEAEPWSANGCFDCNICLDFAKDPVVTLCGHLYCWPCIYKWLQIESETPRQCPVCKAPLSKEALVPLYGRGKSTKQNFDVPRRPALKPISLPSVQHHQLGHDHPYDPDYSGIQNHVFRSTAGGVLELLMVSMLPWMFRNQESIYYSRPQLETAGASSPRRRRQELQAERLLSQTWSFLFCLAMLCLLLF